MKEYWVEYWLQDGTQCSENIDVPEDVEDDGDYIEEQLKNKHKSWYGDIADFGTWDCGDCSLYGYFEKLA